MSVTIKDIPGFPGYRAADDGSVFSNRNHGGKAWCKLSGKTDRQGYIVLLFSVAGKKIHRSAHRIILETFVGPCPEGMEGCHTNGCPSDNRLSNLRWDTALAKNTTQRALAKQFGVSFQQVSRIVRGERWASPVGGA